MDVAAQGIRLGVVDELLFHGIPFELAAQQDGRVAHVERQVQLMHRLGSDQVVVRRKEIVVAADGWAVLFDLPDGPVYTLWNRSAKDSQGVLLTIPGKPGRRFVELLSGRECRSVRKDAGDDVELALPSGEVAAIGAFPKVIESKGEGHFTCPATMALVAIDLSTGKTIASGSGKLEVPKSALGAGRISVRALKDGYLVQDCVEVSSR